MNKTIIILGVLLLVGCTQQTSVSDSTVELTGEVKEFELIAKQFEFIPNTITVNLGDTVELHIESVDVSHGFNLPTFGISERLEPGADVHVDFVASKKGTFTFSCHVYCGAEHASMTGQLIVE